MNNFCAIFDWRESYFYFQSRRKLKCLDFSIPNPHTPPCSNHSIEFIWKIIFQKHLLFNLFFKNLSKNILISILISILNANQIRRQYDYFDFYSTPFHPDFNPEPTRPKYLSKSSLSFDREWDLQLSWFCWVWKSLIRTNQDQISKVGPILLGSTF